MSTSTPSTTQIKRFSSGPFEGTLQQARSQALMAWRPILAVCCGLLCYISVKELAEVINWSNQQQLLISFLASFVLIFPTCLVESRSRCLVGLAPSCCFLEPLNAWWVIYLVTIASFTLGWWLRHRELRAVPAGLKQRQLSKQLSRYPLLHQSCRELAETQNAQQVANTLVEQATSLAMGGLAAGVYIGFANEKPTLRARQGIFPVALGDQADDELILYVADEKRGMHQRNGAQIRILFPLIPEQIIDKGHVGILEILVVHDPHVDDFNIELMQALAIMGSMALGSADLIHEARLLAIRDDLTGLLGQQEFSRRSNEVLNQCQRQQLPLSLLLCDLDHLKEFNDRHGHSTGDQALIAVATILHQLHGENRDAIVGRWGGEEFVILLKGLDTKQALIIAEDICQRVRKTAVDHHPITSSIGLAEWAHDESFEDLLKRTDRACYQAKKRGRDQVAIDQGDRDDESP